MRYIENLTGGTAHIGRAELSLATGLHLSDVRVNMYTPHVLRDASVDSGMTTDRDEALPGDLPVFASRSVGVRHNPWAMLLGKLDIELIEAVEPTCTIVHETTTGHSSLSRIIARLKERADTKGLGADLPLIELRDARVRVLARNPVGTRKVEDLRLTLRGAPAVHDQGLYDIVWHVPNDPGPGGHSQLDLRTGFVNNVHGGLPAMSIEAVMLAINARYDAVGAWNRLLGLTGRVRARDFNLIGVGPDDVGRSVTIDLSDAAISIPINEQEHSLPRTERYLRFLDVNGSVVATTRELRADFTGSLRGASCRVQAAFRGNADELRSLEDVSFDVHLAVRGLTIPRPDEGAPPEQVRFVNHFDRLVDNIETFDPHGVVDVDVHVSRSLGVDEPIKLERALITLRGNDASFDRFPYRGTNLTGEIELTPDGVYVRGLSARHNGATIRLDGWMAAPSKCSQAEFKIQGIDVPIDDDLFNALKKQDRTTARSFSPRGTVNVDVDLTRQACTGDQLRGIWKSVVDIHLTGNASASYDHFPYRLDNLHGLIVVGDANARVVNVRGTPSLSQTGQVRVDGRLGFARGGVDFVDLVVTGEGVNLDESVITALPEAFRDKLRAFQASGLFDIETRVNFDPNVRNLIHESDVTLRGLSAMHESLPLPVTDITGPLTITADRVSTTGLTGKSGEAIISLNGSINPSDPKSHAELFLSCHNVTLNDATLAHVPPTWRRRLGSWRVDSPIDLDLEVRTTTDPETTAVVRGVARMAQADLRNEATDLRLQRVHGEVSFDGASLRGLDITGRWGRAPFRASFELANRVDAPTFAASFEAKAIPLDESTRALLPPRAQAAWDKLKPEGHADLIIDKFTISPKPQDPNESETCSLQGRLLLRNVSLRAASTPKNISGEINLSGNLMDRLGGTVLSGKARLDRMKLLDRDLKDIQAGWSLVQTSDGRGRFGVDPFQADLYGGSVAGDMEINFADPSSTYRLSTTIQGADLNPLVNAATPARLQHTDGPTDVAGRVDAQAYLSGIIGDQPSRRGGGQFRISEGRIYELPLMAAIIHVLNVTLPEPDGPQEAEASFYVMGDNVELGPIAFRGGGIQLVGAGTMTMTDYAVNLNLANVNPRRWGRIPILADFVEGASRELVGLQVTGPVANPTVRTRPLGGIRDEFRKLFQKRQPPPVVRSGQ